MARRSLLLVDGDVRSLRVLEVSLRKAGYNLTTCSTAAAALETLEYAQPDLILCDTRLPGMDGFAFVERLRESPDWSAIPVMFLASDTSVESKVRGLQLGVEDYLTKPIYTKEILARIHLALNRRERDSFARGRASMAKTRFTGSLEDMGLADLLQTIEVSKKSGVLDLRSAAGHGTITFRDGQVLDAELGRVHGERAVYRLLLWNEGDFDIEFRPVRSEAHIQTPTMVLLMEGMRRVDEWGRLLEQVPPLDAVLEVVESELSARLGELPDEVNPVLKAIDGARTLAEVIDALDADDLATLSTISKLFFEGVVQPVQRSRTLRPEAQVPESDAVVGELAAASSDRADSDGGDAIVPRMPSVVPAPGSRDGREPGPSEELPALTPRGTETASNGVVTSGPSEPSSTARLGTRRDLRRTLVGPGFEGTSRDEAEPVAAAGVPAGHDAAPDADSTSSLSAPSLSISPALTSTPSASSPSTPSTTSPPREDDMAKKKKNRGQDRTSVRPEAARKSEPAKASEVRAERAVEPKVQVSTPAALADERLEGKREERRDEAASNVIQFPAKRTVTQVAVNDDVVRQPAQPAEADDTQPRLKQEGDDDSDDGIREADHRSRTASAPSDAPLAAEGEEATNAASEGRGSAGERRERRKKKTPMTESGQMRAIGTGEHAEVTEAFFKAAGHRPAAGEVDDFADLQRSLEPMSESSKRAMWATVGIFVGASAIIGAYWYYQNVHMPQPVALGRAGPVEMPQPSALAPSLGRGAEPSLAPPVVERPASDQTPADSDRGEATVGARGEADQLAGTAAAAEVREGEGSSAGSSAGASPVPAAPSPEPSPGSTPESTLTSPSETSESTPNAPSETYESLLEQALAARGANRQIPLLERAIELRPTGSEALARLSYILVSRPGRANLERARDLAERATAVDPTNAQAWLVLGAARSELGDRVGARAAFEACVEQGQGRFVAECRAMR